MDLDEAQKVRIRNRLRRVNGQITGVIAMLEAGRDCADVLTQLAAASRALDRAGLAMVSAGLEQCILAGEDGAADRARLQRIFLSLG